MQLSRCLKTPLYVPIPKESSAVDVRVTGNAPVTRSILLVTTHENTQDEGGEEGLVREFSAREVGEPDAVG